MAGYKRKEISSSQYVKAPTGDKPKAGEWDQDAQAVKGNSELARTTNMRLAEMKQALGKIFDRLPHPTTPEIIKQTFEQDGYGNKPTSRQITFTKLCQIFYDTLGETKNEEKTNGAEVNRCNNILKFIKAKYKKEDIALSEIGEDFAIMMDNYLAKEMGFGDAHVSRHTKTLKRVIKLAVRKKFLKENPLEAIKPRKIEDESDLVYVPEDDLFRLEDYSFASQRLARVRDTFVFSCYTGLAYGDVAALRDEHFSKGLDGKVWIYKNRQKSKVFSPIPILPKTKEILDKYRDDYECIYKGVKVPVLSNQKMNTYIKEVFEIVGINVPVSTHTGRKTFGMVLLNNDVPIETVSKLMGHKNIRQTQKDYAKVLEKKVGRDMGAFQVRFNSVREQMALLQLAQINLDDKVQLLEEKKGE